MTTFEEVLTQAKEIAKRRGHKMSEFITTNNLKTSISHCLKCQHQMEIKIDPNTEKASMRGDVLEFNCEGR